MFRMHHTHALASVLSLCLVAAPALADSTSSASSAASTSVGSSSASLGTSSNSSSSKERVAQGPYTVLALTDVPQQPGMVTLHLQAMAPADGATAFTLTLPRTTAEREHDLDLSAIMELDADVPDYAHPGLDTLAARIVDARKRNGEILLMMGAHVIRRGNSRFIIDLLRRGIITHIGANGACAIMAIGLRLNEHGLVINFCALTTASWSLQLDLLNSR